MPRITRREMLAAAAAAMLCKTASAEQEVDPWVAKSIERGRTFLVELFDEELDLLPEFRGCERYWLYHDNYLAAGVLDRSHPQIARRIRQAIAAHGVRESGKIEIVLGQAERPLPFREHQLIDVRQVGDKLIKTEVLGERELRDWASYADLLLLAALHLARSDRAQADKLLGQALDTWDGRGFRDRVVDHAEQYATYKCALGLLAIDALDARPAQQAAITERLLAEQRSDGGWITDYDLQGQPVGEANVETTSLAILALEAITPRP